MSMDIYAAVTDRIIAALEQNIIPWKKPWVGTGDAVSHATGKPYSLLNQLLVGRSGEWITFKQALDEGGHVRKGEKSRIVVFWKLLKVKDEDTDEEKEVPFLRYNSVFHIDQCEGITPKYTKPMPDVVQPDAEAEKLMQAYLVRSGVTLTEQQGDTSCYIPSRDAMDNYTLEHKAVVWLVPSTTILQQTLKALRNPAHAYRQQLDVLYPAHRAHSGSASREK